MDIIRIAKDFLRSRRHQYIRTFDSESGKAVLADLAKFCRAHESTYHPQFSDQLDGRREVWLRIQQHINLTDAQLWELYKGKGENG